MMKEALYAGYCLTLISCNTAPIKEVPRPTNVPICLIDIENRDRAICGYGKDSEEFIIDSLELIGTTHNGYSLSEKYIDDLENYIRKLKRRKGCR